MAYEIKVSLKQTAFFLLCLSVVLFPFNNSIFLSMRFVDINLLLLMLIFLLTNPVLKFGDVILILMFFCILAISSVLGILLSADASLERTIFLYKYLLLFFIPIVVVGLDLTQQEIRRLYKLLYYTFLFLSIWAFIYIFLVLNGLIAGQLRVSYPFSDDFNVSDAHLYSSYLGFFFVAYAFYLGRRLNHGILIYTFTLIISAAGIVMTGSRTGILMLCIAFVLKVPFFMRKVYRLDKKAIAILMLISVLVATIQVFASKLEVDVLESISRLIERATNFNLIQDQSSLGRLGKLEIALQDVERGGWIFGQGILSSTLIWYDGILSILMAHGGLSMIVLCCFFAIIFILRAFNKARASKSYEKFYILLLLSFIYLISNLITEYAFITRNVFPIFLFLSILYKEISNECIKYIRGSNVENFSNHSCLE
jgi:hypothetical protein